MNTHGSSTDAAITRISAALSPTGRPLVALDHDGTLSPIAPRPEEAVLVDGAAAAIDRLSELADIAIVSGRGLDDLTRRFERHAVTLISEHGLRCRLPSGAVEQLAANLDPSRLDLLRARLQELLAPLAGWAVEDKDVAIAVHHRLVPEGSLHPTIDQVRALLEEAAQPTGGPHDDPAAGIGGHVQAGKAVLELRPAGADKGSALRWLVARSSPSTVVMVGDDETDEPALSAAEHLGGVGVLVADTPRTTSGTVRLDGPRDVIRLLDRLADILERRERSGGDDQ